MSTELTTADLGQTFTVSDDDLAQFGKTLSEKDETIDPNMPGTTEADTGNEDQGAQDTQDTHGQSGDHEDDDVDGDDEGRTRQSQEEQEAGTPEERAAIRERNRQGRLNQRQRQRQRIDTLERQLANSIASNQELAQRIGQLEGTNQHTQLASFAQAERNAAEAVQGLQAIIADASSKGDGARVAEATVALQTLLLEQRDLVVSKQQFEQSLRQPRQQKPQAVDPETMRHAQAFMSRNSWYKGPRAPDRDSRIMAMLDQELFNEGWNPSQASYWTELETRAKGYLSHRFNGRQTDGGQMQDQNNDQGHNAGQGTRRPKSPIAGGGTNRSNGGGNQQTVTMNEARVRAMKEAGIWDDPKRRAKVIAQYQKIDQGNS